MTFELFKRCNRGGYVQCNKCNGIVYMTPGHIRKIVEPICIDCIPKEPKLKKPRKRKKSKIVASKKYVLWKDAPQELKNKAIELHQRGFPCADNVRIVKIDRKSLYYALYRKYTPKQRKIMEKKPRIKPILTLEEKLAKRIYSFCNAKPAFTLEEFMAKIGPEPKCYLTGAPIDLSDTSSYHLDHIVPSSRGGDNSLENCGLASAAANRAKSDMTVEEFRQLCRLVLDN